MALSRKDLGFHIACNVNSSKIIKAVEMQGTVHLRTQGTVPGGRDSSTVHSSLPSRICLDQTVLQKGLLGSPSLELEYALP